MPPPIPRFLKLALDTPLAIEFDYRWQPQSADDSPPRIGQLAQVPFGRRQVVGLIVAIHESSDHAAEKIRDITAIRHQLPPLSSHWMALSRFAADYYQRPLGEVALPCLPKNLRALKSTALDTALKKTAATPQTANSTATLGPELNADQKAAVDAISAASDYSVTLLFGVTGSGKTEVYLRSAEKVLEREQQQGIHAQVLMLVPEINLTPQLENSVRARFPGMNVVSLHSQLSEGERTRSWLSAHLGHASIVLGTRLSVLASMPNLKLIIVDEEHDPSYKQQEGLRYSARDLAIWRARDLNIPIVIGSATPSMESWHHAESGRYRKLVLAQRAATQAVLPNISLIDMERIKATEGLSPPLVAALRERLARGEQSLLYLNRRGYAPVVHCDACGWISNCQRCTAFMVLHKPEKRLRCHHCSLELKIPSSCPTCGNVDLQPLGRGTQRIEEHLQVLFPEARVLRIDADSTRKKGSAQAAFATVHRGEVDILLGTQMVAKGHDFQRLTLVGVINPDTALFSHDYRAGERLFAQLMQVAGRAGRAARMSQSEVMVQTRYAQHPLYRALLAHDFPGFAAATLEERRSAGLPPFVFQAMLRAESTTLTKALEFLQQARELLPHPGIVINDPVPVAMTRVANVERAQLLLESPARGALQGFLKLWVQELRKQPARLRWTLEVDPIDI